MRVCELRRIGELSTPFLALCIHFGLIYFDSLVPPMLMVDTDVLEIASYARNATTVSGQLSYRIFPLIA